MSSASGSNPIKRWILARLVLDLSSEQGRSPADWNIAQKGIAVRLDKGPGGISKGNLDPLR